MPRLDLSLALLSALVFTTTSAHAQTSSPAVSEGASDAFRHESLYLRIGLGAGYARSGARNALGNELTVTGPATAWSLAIGYTVWRNLILFYEYRVTSASDPTFDTGRTARTADGGELEMTSSGVGAMVYWSEPNVFVGGVVESPVVTLGDGRGGFTSFDDGFGFGVMAGKEWWVSERWGLGFFGRVDTFWVSDVTEYASADFRLTELTAGVSATFD